MNNNENPSYYAIIPANVRYDKDLSANAKLLYGEITALCNKEGYCWATNNYFAKLYNVSARSIQTWLKQLINKGYIKSKSVINKNVESERRYLYICDNNFADTTKKTSYPHEEIFTPSHEENFAHNNTSMNNTNNNISSSNDKGTKEAKKVKKDSTQDEELFNKFWAEYPKKRDKQSSKKAFTKLNVDVKLFNQMMASLSQAKQSYDWQKNNGQYIPYPSTWLNGRRWEDELSNVSQPQTHREEKKQNEYNEPSKDFDWF